jgi:hypothetical protein
MRMTFAALMIFSAALLPARADRPARADKPDRPTASIVVQKDHIDFFAGKSLVTRYVIGPKVAKPYFYPLHSPSGATLTRPYPMEKLEKGEKADHPHHKSAWFCHGEVVPDGPELAGKFPRGVDFWSEAPGHGRIVCTRVGRVEMSRTGDSARITTWNEWRAADGTKVLDEVRTLELINYGDAWLLRLTSDLHASVTALVFGDTKEGSLGVRVRDVMRADKKGTLTNAEGKAGEGKRKNADRTGCWGLRSAWCDYSGPTGDGVAGIAIFADPRNAVPTAWHSRNYGLMAANPFGRDKSEFPDTKGQALVKVGKGEHLVFCYGLLLHDGDVKAGKVAEHYRRFAKLPRAD